MALVKAEIENLVTNETITVRFNPSQYKISKQVNYGNIEIQSIEAKMLTYQSGEPKTLSLELFFDMDNKYKLKKDNNENGVKAYTEEIMKLTSCENNDCPPLCRFKWGNFIFTGYVNTVEESFTRFDNQGIPIRAVINLSMIESYAEKKYESKFENKTEGVVNTAQDLYNVLQNPLEWREAAQKLGIINPRELT